MIETMSGTEMKSITKVIPGDDFTLILQFESGEVRFIDMKPFIGGEVWAELQDPEMFNTVRIDDFGGLEWGNGLSYCPDSAFMDSTELPLRLLQELIGVYHDARQKQQKTGTDGG